MSDEQQADRGERGRKWLLSVQTIEAYQEAFGPVEVHVYTDSGDHQSQPYRLILHDMDDDLDGEGAGRTLTEALRNAIDDTYGGRSGD